MVFLLPHLYQEAEVDSPGVAFLPADPALHEASRVEVPLASPVARHEAVVAVDREDDAKSVQFQSKLERSCGRLWSPAAFSSCVQHSPERRYSRVIFSSSEVVDFPGTPGRMAIFPPNCSMRRRSSWLIVSMV